MPLWQRRHHRWTWTRPHISLFRFLETKTGTHHPDFRPGSLRSCSCVCHWHVLTALIVRCSGVPGCLFYLTGNGRVVDSGMYGTQCEFEPGQVIRMRGRLCGGASTDPRFGNGGLETEWFCAACNRGGCWATKQRCFHVTLYALSSCLCEQHCCFRVSCSTYDQMDMPLEALLDPTW